MPRAKPGIVPAPELAEPREEQGDRERRFEGAGRYVRQADDDLDVLLEMRANDSQDRMNKILLSPLYKNAANASRRIRELGVEGNIPPTRDDESVRETYRKSRQQVLEFWQQCLNMFEKGQWTRHGLWDNRHPWFCGYKRREGTWGYIKEIDVWEKIPEGRRQGINRPEW